MKLPIEEFVRPNRQFREVLVAFVPKRILEIGSWHGRSAVTFVWQARNLGLETRVLCVDTWLGSKEHWLDHFPGGEWSRAALELRDGQPSFIDRFWENVRRYGLEKNIEVLRAPSNVALAYLEAERESFDLVYIDGDHSYRQVREDLEASSKVLKAGGILLGDDWSWRGVRLAALLFALTRGLFVFRSGNTWVLATPSDSRARALCDSGWVRVSGVGLVRDLLRVLLFAPYRLVRATILRVFRR